MASGRVGGTKSKKSGQVGTNIYQIRKNADGSYSQIVTIKGVTTVNRTTPRLQAQRMCTAMVQSLMKQLSPVAKISMQSAANKSKSLNAFSSFNLMRVARDCKANWYSNAHYVFPYYSPTSYEVEDLGGLYMLSAGTLQWNLFSDCYDPWTHEHEWYDPVSWYYINSMVRWSDISDIRTIGDFWKKFRFGLLDCVVFCAFKYQWGDVDPEGEETFEIYKHCYVIAHRNMSIPDSAPFNYDNFKNMFVIETNDEPLFFWRRDNSACGLGFRVENWEYTGSIPYMGAFSISYVGGKKLISNSQYHAEDDDNPNWEIRSNPADVFGSWMGERWRDPYPSPFV